MKAHKALQEAIIYFANPDNCLAYVAAHPWPEGVECPTCGRKDGAYLANQKKWQRKSAHAKRQFTAEIEPSLRIRLSVLKSGSLQYGSSLPRRMALVPARSPVPLASLRKPRGSCFIESAKQWRTAP